MVVSDALAGHLHQVQVRARDDVNNESQWSDWSPLVLEQPWEGGGSTTHPADEALEHHIPTFQPPPDASTAKTRCEFSNNRPVSHSNGRSRSGQRTGLPAYLLAPG